MKIEKYTRLMKHIYSNKIVLTSYFIGALIGYLVTSYFNDKQFMSIGYLVYYFVFISLFNANIYLFNRWRKKQNKKRLIRSFKQEKRYKTFFYNNEGSLGDLDSLDYAKAVYKVKSNDLLLFKQVLNFPLVLLQTIALGVRYIPIFLVSLGLGLSYYDDVAISQLTIGELLSKDLLYFILKINILIIVPVWIYKYKSMPGFINFRSRELTRILSEKLPILTISNGWGCYSEIEYVANDKSFASESTKT